jgi:rhodanese-related sulfurtransferase
MGRAINSKRRLVPDFDCEEKKIFQVMTGALRNMKNSKSRRSESLAKRNIVTVRTSGMRSAMAALRRKRRGIRDKSRPAALDRSQVIV